MTTMMMSESVSTITGDETCRTCGQTMDWHQANKPIHPFNNGEAGATAFLGPRRDRDTRRGGSDASRASEGPQRVVFPTDPALRVALINAGVITGEQIEAAEASLRVAMGLGGEQVVESPAEARRGEVQVGAPAQMDVGQRPLGGEEVGAQPEDQQG